MAEGGKPAGGYSRKSLYEMVWKEPVEDIAKRVGLSGRGLAKLCERNSIPVPPRGYWQKKTAGQQTGPRPPLIELPGQQFPHLDSAIRQAVSNSSIQPPVRGVKSELFQLYAREVALDRKIKVPKSLRSLHPVPEQWVKDTRCSLSLIEEAPLESRTYKIYSGLLSFAETAGFTVAQPKPVPLSCVLSYQGIRLEICIRERTRHIRRHRTSEEIAAEPWLGTKWRNIQEPTGELFLMIASEADNLRQPKDFPTSWGDSLESGLETKLPEVFAGLIANVAFVQQHRAIERERELAERRRIEAAEERRRQREKAEEQKAKLRRDSIAWREAVDLRAFVAAVQSAGADRIAALPMPLEEWVQWSLAVADEIDPLR